MKSTGIIMLCTGTASTVSGIILISSADWERTSDVGSVNYNSTDNEAVIGTVLAGVGLGLIGGGIAMTIFGSKKSQKYKMQLDKLTLVPYFDSEHTGNYLSLRF